jgi:hypothetical protein
MAEAPFEARLARLRESFGDLDAGGAALAPPIMLGSLALREVADAKDAAGALFRKGFHADIPRFPRHFVLSRRDAAGDQTLGYVHYTRAGPIYLGGGLVVAALGFRALDRPTADLVRSGGGLAEWMTRTSCAALDGECVFAYIGDTMSIRVNTRVGFEFTGHPRLYALWKGSPAPDRKAELARRLAEFGSF